MEYAYLDENNSLVETNDMRWAYDQMDGRSKLKQEVVGDYFISSIFLPLNHSFGNSGAIHFETYVFPQKDDKISDFGEVWGRRAQTFDECMRYHEEAKALIEAGKILEDA